MYASNVLRWYSWPGSPRAVTDASAEALVHVPTFDEVLANNQGQDPGYLLRAWGMQSTGGASCPHHVSAHATCLGHFSSLRGVARPCEQAVASVLKAVDASPELHQLNAPEGNSKQASVPHYMIIMAYMVDSVAQRCQQHVMRGEHSRNPLMATISAMNSWSSPLQTRHCKRGTQLLG